MGQMLAASEPGLRPVLEDAHRHSSYTRFMLAHRHRLSRLPFMAPWESRLRKLVEIEAKHHGLKAENPAHWNTIEKSISFPLHCAFWYGWEQVHTLWQKYERAVSEHRAKHGDSALLAADQQVPPGTIASEGPSTRVADTPPLTTPPSTQHH